MKKIIALVLCLAVVFTLSVSAFAESPAATPKYEVTMRKGTGVSGITANDSPVVVTDGDVIIAKPDTTNGTFNNWTVYKRNTDGTFVEATPGVDYELVDGSKLTDQEIKLKAKADIIFCANYNNTITKPESASSVPGSPKTGDMSVVYVMVMLAAAAMFLGAKKVYSK